MSHTPWILHRCETSTSQFLAHSMKSLFEFQEKLMKESYCHKKELQTESCVFVPRIQPNLLNLSKTIDLRTVSLFHCQYGRSEYDIISQSKTPKLHTSLAEVNCFLRTASGAVHRIGNLQPCRKYDTVTFVKSSMAKVDKLF